MIEGKPVKLSRLYRSWRASVRNGSFAILVLSDDCLEAMY